MARRVTKKTHLMKRSLITLLIGISALNICCKESDSILEEQIGLNVSTETIDESSSIESKETLQKMSPEALRVRLQKAVNDAAAKNQKLVLPSGTYYISDEVILPSNLLLEGSASKTQIILVNGNKNGRNLFRIPTRTNNIKIKNIQLNSNQNGNSGADLVTLLVADNVSNLTFENVTFTGGRDRGAVQIKGLNDYPVQNVIFSKCTFNEAGRTSLELRGTKNVLISDCVFKNWGNINPNSPAIQLQSQDNIKPQIIRNTFDNSHGKQFAIECAAAYVVDGKISENKLNDPQNLGGNGISGYYKRTEISKNVFSGGNGNQRSGLEIFGQHNTLSENTIPAGCIAIAPGLKELGTTIVINNNQVKTSGPNVGGIQIGGGSSAIDNVRVTNNTVDTRLSTGNSSGIVVGTYGTPQVVTNIIVQGNTINTNAHCIRLQSLGGSKNIQLLNNRFITGYTWLGVITNTFSNVSSKGNVNSLDNTSISYSSNMPAIIQN
jgi:hypothetical protein